MTRPIVNPAVTHTRKMTTKHTILGISLLSLSCLTASAAVTSIGSATITSTTNSSQFLTVTPSGSPSVIETTPFNFDFAPGDYTLSIDALFTEKPDKNLGLRFDGIGGDDNTGLWSSLSPAYDDVNINEWNTYTASFSITASGDNEGRIEFRLENTGGAGNVKSFSADNYVITLAGTGVVFQEDFEDEMVGSTTSGVGTGGDAQIVASVPEPSSSALLGSIFLFSLARRCRS